MQNRVYVGVCVCMAGFIRTYVHMSPCACISIQNKLDTNMQQIALYIFNTSN